MIQTLIYILLGICTILHIIPIIQFLFYGTKILLFELEKTSNKKECYQDYFILLLVCFIPYINYKVIEYTKGEYIFVKRLRAFENSKL